MHLACFLKAVDSVRLSGWLSPGLLKITFVVVLCLTWDGPDRMRPNCVSVAATVSFRFGAITDLASVCIFFGVAPVRRVWKGVSSERSEDKLNLFFFWCRPRSPRYGKGFGVLSKQRRHVIRLVLLVPSDLL